MPQKPSPHFQRNPPSCIIPPPIRTVLPCNSGGTLFKVRIMGDQLAHWDPTAHLMPYQGDNSDYWKLEDASIGGKHQIRMM